MIFTFFRSLFRDLYRQPLRTVLTLSGVIWGTLAVILLLAFGGSVQRQSMKSFRGMGQAMVLIFPGRTTMAYKGLTKGRPIRITPQQVEELPLKVEGILRISPEYIQNKRIRYGREESLNTVRGINSQFEAMRNTIPAQGRFIDPTDLEFRRRVCFLGNRLADQLFHASDPVGNQVLIEGVPFLVIGVMKEKTQNSNYNGQRDELCAFIPWTTLDALYGQKYVSNLIFQPAAAQESAVLIERIREFWGSRLGFAPQDKDALFIWDVSDFEKKFNVFLLAFNIFLGMIGSFTLLVGGVGVASIMMIVVEERTREIGVKLAVGAKRRHILLQFFSEALMIVLIGGCGGFFLAATVLRAIPVEKIKEYIGIPQLDPTVGIATVAILLIIGVVSGLMPARRAASTNPIEALRK